MWELQFQLEKKTGKGHKLLSTWVWAKSLSMYSISEASNLHSPCCWRQPVQPQNQSLHTLILRQFDLLLQGRPPWNPLTQPANESVRPKGQPRSLQKKQSLRALLDFVRMTPNCSAVPENDLRSQRGSDSTHHPRTMPEREREIIEYILDTSCGHTRSWF